MWRRMCRLYATRSQSLLRHSLLGALMAACGGRGDSTLTPLQRDLLNITPDIHPLFVIGDVNEDLRVDTLDGRLIAQIASRSESGNDAPCLAAADVTLDGVVDDSDVRAFARLTNDSTQIVSLPLYRQPYMPCRHSNRIVAAPAHWRRGLPIRLRLLGQRQSAAISVSLPDSLGDVKSLADGTGWEITLPAFLAPGSFVTIRFSLDDDIYSYTLAGEAAQDPAKAPAEIVRAGWTDTNEVGVPQDPMTRPPPTIWGEAVDSLETCPQKGKGCEALVIDFMKNFWDFVDADQTKEALESIGCNVIYSTPSFVEDPRPYFVLERRIHSARWVEIRPSQEAIDRANTKNAAAWGEVRDAIARHRSNVRSGKELVLQLVNAHGNNEVRYGDWGPGFATAAGYLSRLDFHAGNYHATHGNTCHAVALDRSCYSGNTARAVERLNNTGQSNHWEAGPGRDHGFHAAFWGDMAITTASASETCNNGDVLVADVISGRTIRRRGANGNFQRLASLGFRNYVLSSEAVGKYSDRGYNRRPTTQCQDAFHLQAY